MVRVCDLTFLHVHPLFHILHFIKAISPVTRRQSWNSVHCFWVFWKSAGDSIDVLVSSLKRQLTYCAASWCVSYMIYFTVCHWKLLSVGICCWSITIIRYRLESFRANITGTGIIYVKRIFSPATVHSVKSKCFEGIC